MNTTVSLDSFQLIVGLYLLYVAIKGDGTLYRFFDLPEDDQKKVKRPLRMIYALCGVLALAEAAFCMWLGNGPVSSISDQTLSAISFGCSALIIIILIVTFIWLRRKAK